MPTPQKFGTPPVITSANLSTIDGATTIQTDPIITRNGETGEGRIYRDPATDGSRSTWLFGATSRFDNTSGFESGFDTSNFLTQIVVFKFNDLILAGDPTISTANGGPTTLGLVGVNSITTNGGGAMLSFTGIDTLLLATQNGSINLGADVSFNGLARMFIYARGAGSSLTIGSAIDTTADLRLYSEGAVTISGALSTLNFSSFSGGDFTIGGNGLVTAGGIYITSLGNIVFDSNRFSPGAFSNISLSLNASGVLSIDARSSQAVFNNAGSVDLSGGTIALLADNPYIITFNSNAAPNFTARAGGIQGGSVGLSGNNITLTSSSDISIGSFNAYIFTLGGTLSGTIHAAGAFSSPGDISLGDLFAGTSISIGGQILASFITAGTTINVAGQLAAFEQVTAGGDITAETVAVPNIDSPNGILTAGAGGILPFVVVFEDQQNPPPNPGDGANLQHTFNVSSIVSPNGIDFSGNQYNGISGLSSGGRLTINATTLLFDVNGGIGFVNFDGADMGAFSNGGPSAAGDGGIFIANATGDITVNSVIEATSGLHDASSAPSGNGGTVMLHSTGGQVALNSLIEVSANDNSGPAQIHQSASGGNITVQSDAASGTAISISSVAQLLSLLDANAAGPGGSIIFLATGAASTIDINNGDGSIVADRGRVDIRQLGDFGGINLTLPNIFANIVKIGALGANGTLTITGGTISADTILRLYAGGSNGSIIFAGNVSLGSANASIFLAARTITIMDNVVVTLTGMQASVFADIRNYAGPGGNGTTTGVFSGLTVVTQAFANAPPFDNPGEDVHHAAPHAAAIHLANSTQLLDLIETGQPDASGRRVYVRAARNVGRSATGPRATSAPVAMRPIAASRSAAFERERSVGPAQPGSGFARGPRGPMEN